MEIQKILRYRFYTVLALVYVISVVALCLHAPVVQQSSQQLSSGSSSSQPVVLQPGDVDNPPPVPPITLDWSTAVGMDGKPIPPVTFDPSRAVGLDDKPTPPVALQDGDFEVQGGSSEPPAQGPVNPYAKTTALRAPLWELGSKFALNIPLFTAEVVELLGFVVVIGLAYRFKSRLLNWATAIYRFIAAHRRGSCIWLGFTIVLVLTLFPPWVQINTYGGRYHTQRKILWHAPIFRAPVETTYDKSPAVDYDRMLTEIAVGECFVLALYLTWARTSRLSI